MSTDTPPVRPVAQKSNLGGWYKTSRQAHEAAQRRAVLNPAPATPPKKQKERAPIPAALSKPATLWLACHWCKLPQLATADRVLLWHRMEWRGERVECTGTNTIGLPLEEVGK